MGLITNEMRRKRGRRIDHAAKVAAEKAAEETRALENEVNAFKANIPNLVIEIRRTVKDDYIQSASGRIDSIDLDVSHLLSPRLVGNRECTNALLHALCEVDPRTKSVKLYHCRDNANNARGRVRIQFSPPLE